MFEYLLLAPGETPPEDRRIAQAVTEARALGWGEVVAVRRLPGFDAGPDADADAQAQDIFRAEPERWLACSAGDLFLVISIERDSLCREAVTVYENGSRVVTFELNPSTQAFVDDNGLTDWPEGGAHMRVVPEGALADLLDAARRNAREVGAAEGAAMTHTTADDVATAKRIGARLADNWGWSQSLGAFFKPEPDASAPLHVRASTLAHNRSMAERDARLTRLMTERVPVTRLRARPTIPSHHEHALARWRNWTDDEEEAAHDLDPDDPALLADAVGRFADAMCTCQDLPPPSPPLRAAFIQAVEATRTARSEDELRAAQKRLMAVQDALGWQLDEPARRP